jgi:hypothetical protein
MFRLIAKALGEKSGNSDKEANTIAWIRIVFLFQAVLTNAVIIMGVIRQW